MKDLIIILIIVLTILLILASFVGSYTNSEPSELVLINEEDLEEIDEEYNEEIKKEDIVSEYTRNTQNTQNKPETNEVMKVANVAEDLDLDLVTEEIGYDKKSVLQYASLT